MTAIITILDDEILIAPLGPDEGWPEEDGAQARPAAARRTQDLERAAATAAPRRRRG